MKNFAPMQIRRPFSSLMLALALIAPLGMSGCASGLSNWIADTRIRQGTRSLEGSRYRDAAKSFKLALQIRPEDQRAKDGFIEAQADQAERLYQESRFKEAIDAVKAAQEIDPQSVRLAGLLIDISSARVKREIVRSNYASYEATTNALLTGYDALHVHELDVMDRLKKFSYSYDIADLTRALRSSTQLETDVKKLNARLTQLRTLASAGTITPEANGTSAATSSTSLLPLP